VEDSHQCLPQEDTIIEGTIIEVFEDALGLRVSPKHRGRCGITKEQHAEEYTKLVRAVHRTARTHGRGARSTMMLSSFIRSTTIHSEVSNGCIMKTEEEEEERRVHLEKRLEPNVDLDDALQVLDSTRISNLEQPWIGAILYGVGVNTHKELDLEVLMTLASVINEGVSCLSFRLEDEEQLVPFGYNGELLGYKKEARSKLMSKKKILEGLLGNDFERRLQGTQNFSLSRFLWNRIHEARKVEMRGEGTSWRKLIFLFPMRG
jgi:hypothetical protein